MKVIAEIDHEVRDIRETRVFVRQYIFADGVSSYDVHLAEPDDRLLNEEGFDHIPSDDEIEALPYIKPTVMREAPGVYYILTGPYRQGPYASRREADTQIRKGNW